MRALEYMGDDYQVSLTRPKRNCDVARFLVQKAGGRTYTVTFQRMDGSKSQCDCKAGIHRKLCRHVKMLKPLLAKAVASTTAAKPPPAQTSLPLPNPVEDEYLACRAEYGKILNERKTLDDKLKALEAKGKALKLKLGKVAA